MDCILVCPASSFSGTFRYGLYLGLSRIQLFREFSLWIVSWFAPHPAFLGHFVMDCIQFCPASSFSGTLSTKFAHETPSPITDYITASKCPTNSKAISPSNMTKMSLYIPLHQWFVGRLGDIVKRRRRT